MKAQTGPWSLSCLGPPDWENLLPHRISSNKSETKTLVFFPSMVCPPHGIALWLGAVPRDYLFGQRIQRNLASSPRSLRRALEHELPRDQEGSWVSPSPCRARLATPWPCGEAASGWHVAASGPGFSSQLHLAKRSHLIHISEVQSQGGQKHGAAAGEGGEQESHAACLLGLLTLSSLRG